MKRTLALVLSIVMVLGLFLAGCGSKAPEAEQATEAAKPQTSTEDKVADAAPEVVLTAREAELAEAQAHKGGTLTMGYTDIRDFFNPYKQGNLVSFGFGVYQPLAYCDDDDVWTPCLAESWERDDENFTLTVHLRKDVTFSGGEAMTADDVVFSHAARLEYGTGSVIGNPVSIEKIDDYTVVFTWDSFSLNYEVWVLGQYIYSKSKFDEKGLDWMMNNMYGTGPYVMEKFIPDVTLELSRNENYWEDITPSYDKLVWNVYADSTALLAAFLNGEIAVCQAGTDADRVMLEAAGYEETFLAKASEAQYYVVPITMDPEDPWSNPDVRRAVYLYGIDWDSMATVCGGATGFHTDSLGATGMTYYDESLEQAEYNPEKAKQLLAEAGYPDGFKTVIYSMGFPWVAYLQAELLNLGIEADTESVDFSMVQGEYLGGKGPKNGIITWVQVNSPANQMDRFVKHLNSTGTIGGSTTWSDELVALWETTKTSKTMEEQNANLLAYVEELVLNQCMVWPVYNTTSGNYYQDYVTFGYYYNATGGGSGSNPFFMWPNT